MTKVIVGNSDTPLSYGVHFRGQMDARMPNVNMNIVSHDNEVPPPKLNNAPVLKGGGIAGGSLLHHPSRMEQLVGASKGKHMSRLDFFNKAHRKS